MRFADKRELRCTEGADRGASRVTTSAAAGAAEMQRRHQYTNIPIEILRSLVAITDTGSITKAATLLGLSQPAISAQIKRIEAMVGGSLFQRTANGSTPTELGKLVLLHARKILDANDQLLRLRGTSGDEQSLRIGLSNLFANTVVDVVSRSDSTRMRESASIPTIPRKSPRACSTASSTSPCSCARRRRWPIHR